MIILTGIEQRKIILIQSLKFLIYKKTQFSILNNKFKIEFKKRNLHGKLIVPKINSYLKIKHKIKNSYLKLDINDENMSFVLTLSKLSE